MAVDIFAEIAQNSKKIFPTSSLADFSQSIPKMSDLLRAELSYRIRTQAPKDWAEFTALWIAFNAIYGGEPDRRERSRVMASIRRHFNQTAARRVLRDSRADVAQILAIPPGNLLLNVWDSKFRAATQRLTAMYRNQSERSVGRLAAVAGILYQIRCNLMHGSKDPNVPRDRMLITASVSVLRHMLPELENAAGAL